jgi:hypothetical protein
MAITEKQSVEYNYFDSLGVHQFLFTESSHRAVDEWLAGMSKIAIHNQHDGTIRYILDNTLSGMIPLSYALKRLQEINKRFPDRPRTRVAVIHPQHFMISVMDSFFRLLRSDKDVLRFFPTGRRDEAVAWLKDR